jgi:hypothetical protein
MGAIDAQADDRCGHDRFLSFQLLSPRCFRIKLGSRLGDEVECVAAEHEVRGRVLAVEHR